MFYEQGLIYWILAPFFIITGILATIFFSKKYGKAEENTKLKPIRWAFFVLLVLEFVKIFLLIGRDEVFKPLRFPFVFCSMVLYAYPLFCFKKTRLAEVGKAFAILPSFFAGALFLIMPVTLATNTPLDIFISIHSFLFHAIMVCVAAYILATKIYDFAMEKYYSIFLVLAGYTTFAFVTSLFIGGNISFFGPDSAYVGFVYNWFGYVPGNLIIIAFFYLLSFALYKLINIAKNTKEKRQIER